MASAESESGCAFGENGGILCDTISPTGMWWVFIKYKIIELYFPVQFQLHFFCCKVFVYNWDEFRKIIYMAEVVTCGAITTYIFFLYFVTLSLLGICKCVILWIFHGYILGHNISVYNYVNRYVPNSSIFYFSCIHINCAIICYMVSVEWK